MDERGERPAGRAAEGERLITSVANQRLWIEAKLGTDPPAVGPALALAWEGRRVEYLICDVGERSGGKLAWVDADNVEKASIRAPLTTASLANQRVWIKTKRDTVPAADGHVLAVRTDEQSTEYLVCDDVGDQLVWVDAENVDAASIKKPTPSRLPTKKVTAAGAGGASAAAVTTAGVALLEALNVDVSPEASAAVTSFITALAAFASGYIRRDPAAVDTPAAAQAASPPAP